MSEMTNSFAVFADGSANLPKEMLEGITLLPCEYTVDGKPQIYEGDIDRFDGHAYYEGLRNGKKVSTSLLNGQTFLTHFTPVLEEGRDIVYVSMSSGISGTYNAAVSAAAELMEQYPDRFIHVVDSHGCGFGNALLAVKAAELSRDGVDVRKAAQILDEEVPHTCQYFTVDDLNFLKRTGRVSGATAMIGTVLNIKPILKIADDGTLISIAKKRGLAKASAFLAECYEAAVDKSLPGDVIIAHADCSSEAETIRKRILASNPDANVMVCGLGPVIGAHTGPGMAAVIHWGNRDYI